MRDLLVSELSCVAGGRSAQMTESEIGSSNAAMGTRAESKWLEIDEENWCVSIGMEWGGMSFSDTFCATPDGAFAFLDAFIDQLSDFFGGSAGGVAAVISGLIDVGRQTLQQGIANIQTYLENVQQQIDGVPAP